MPGPSDRFSQVRGLQSVACVVAMVFGAVLAVAGVVRSAGSGGAADVWMIAAGALMVFLAVMFLTLTPMLSKMEGTIARQLGELRELRELIAEQAPYLSTISENIRLSDAARALAHREQEIDALRAVIRQDIRDGKWEAALYLVDEIERRFGYKEEAEQLREEVDDARISAINAKLGEAIALVEAHFQAHQWDRAQREIDRLLHALPDNPRVLGLQSRMRELREEHKQELRLAWEDAVRRCDTDHAIDVLRALDQYLTADEVQELQDSARNVFKEKLLQLGVQFRFAVTEKRWQDSLSIGLELIRDFPNSRMANEVREVLDMLRERARMASETVAPA
jgi:tetratricopeptide (TPR) repeat protein